MTADPFTDRLARVRDRFASTLAAKIDDTCAGIARLAQTAPEAAGAVEQAYRSIHGIVGVGRTVGFPATGQAAHQVEDVLRPSYQTQRGMTVDELSLLTTALQALRETAARELKSFQAPQQ